MAKGAFGCQRWAGGAHFVLAHARLLARPQVLGGASSGKSRSSRGWPVVRRMSQP